MKTISRTFRGFTLIELLVTIAIIALLTGIVMTSLAPSKGKARDAKRISDLGNIQLALELYFDRCKEYPALHAPFNGDPGNYIGIFDQTYLSSANGKYGSGGDSCPSGISFATFMSQIPTPPGSSLYEYTVIRDVNGDTDHPSDFVLHTQLESTNEAVKDGINESRKPSYVNFQCYDANHPKDYCLGAK